jgi:hypothetical protein
MTGIAPWAGLLALLTAAAAGLPALVSQAPAAAWAGGAAGASTFVLGPDGVVYSWKSGEDFLTPLPPSLRRLAGHPVNDLAIAGRGGRAVVLLASQPEAETRHKQRREGAAVVLSSPTPASPPAVLNEIGFEGNGRRVALSEDGRYAYVLAIRAGTDASGGPVRAWLHLLDLEEGRLLSSTPLDGPPSSIALDPTGSRLYLAYAGRIVSYTTHPLARSWHYRSPGSNRMLCFQPRSAVLYSMRQEQIAQFDPAVIGARKPEQRQRQEDDATAVVRAPFAADSLAFSEDGRMAVAYGPGDGLAFFDPASGTIVGTEALEGLDAAARQNVRPVYFGPGPGDLVIGSFPDRRVRTIRPPAPPAAPAAPAATILEAKASDRPPEPPAADPGGLSPAPAPTLAPTPVGSPVSASVPAEPPPPAPPVAPVETAHPASPIAPAETAPVLSGRISGRLDAVRIVVLFGPGSIVHEQARALPGRDGTWRIPLPPPGTYRIVPLGENTRPLRSEPNFLVVDVQDQGRSDLDFRILGPV